MSSSSAATVAEAEVVARLEVNGQIGKMSRGTIRITRNTTLSLELWEMMKKMSSGVLSGENYPTASDSPDHERELPIGNCQAALG